MEQNEIELPQPVNSNNDRRAEDTTNVDNSPITRSGSDRNPEFLPDPSSNTSVNPLVGATKTGVQDSQQAPVKDNSAIANVNPVSGTAPLIADDVDLIEKEWVEKAKEIVNKTKDNPYLQNKAINEVKAEYIKKRYNKEIPKSG